jgi:hypothetical protein
MKSKSIMAMVFITPLAEQVVLIGALVFWSATYFLMFRRGLKDRSYGMPLVALCVNVVWEFIFAFFFDTPLRFRMVNLVWLLLDLGVLYTCWRFGAGDFSSRLVKKYFHAIIILTLALALFTEFGFIYAFKDFYGGFSATLTTMLLSGLMLGMLFQRDSVQGQSFYIGFCILAGDICGYFMNVNAHETVAPQLPLLWIKTANVCIVVCNLLYLLLFVKVCRRDGINPFRRL